MSTMGAMGAMGTMGTMGIISAMHVRNMRTTRRNTTMRHGAWRPSAGITMIEIIIALAVVAILAAVAYPSYKDKVYSARRSDARTALSDLATRLESYYSKTNTYATATIAAGTTTDVLAVAATAQGNYTLSIDGSNTTATTYKILATPIGAQAGDTRCGTLGLTSANVKSATGTDGAKCW